MKKLTSFFILIIFLLGPGGIRPAQAVVPLALLAPAAVGATVLAVGAATYYAPQVFEAGKKTVDTVKETVGTSLIAAKAITVAGEQYLFGKAVQAEIGINALADWAAENVGDAPITTAALQAASGGYRDPVSVGDILDPGDGYPLRLVSSETVSALNTTPTYLDATLAANNGWNATRTTYMETVVVGQTEYYDGSIIIHLEKSVFNTLAAPAGSVPTNPQSIDLGAFDAALPDTEAAAVEIQKAMAANPNAVTVPELTPAEISQAYDQAQALAAQEYANDVLAQSQTDPTNQELQSLALEAQQAAEQAALEAQQEEVTETFTGPMVASPARNSIDLSPFYDLQGLAATKFPFSLVSSISNFFSSLVGTRKTPAIIWDYRGLIHFDISLSSWDPYAANLRLLIAFFFHAGILYSITRRWSH